MSHSAEALTDLSSRNITIEISNNTRDHVLINPKIYYESGHCHVPPQPVISPGDHDLCNFTKTTASSSGAVGVCTFDIVKPPRNHFIGKIAIMFSVPHSQTTYKNWFGLGVFKSDTKTDKELYKKMYYDKEPEGFVRALCSGSVLTYNHDAFELMATASPLGQCIMKFEIWDKFSCFT